MCRIAFHNCPDCGEEYKCEQGNSECPVLAGFDVPCAKCEYWTEEVHKEYERAEERKQELAEWEEAEWKRDQWKW